MYKPTVSNTESENEMEKTMIADPDEYHDHGMITPPTTPNFLVDAIEKNIVCPKKESNDKETVVAEEEKQEISITNFCQKKVAILGFALAAVLTAVVLFSQAIVLRNHGRSINNISLELEILRIRFEALEQENQLLKSNLYDLEASFRDVPVDKIAERVVELPQPVVDDKLTRPKTKKVWVGNEIEETVEIIDKKQSLPDYCYFTEEDDLFFEYNAEKCEKKKRKLEAKNLKDKKDNKGKQADDLSLDNIWKIQPQESYDDYVTETLKSLNDEIQNIKNKRVDSSKIINSTENKDQGKDKLPTITDIEKEKSPSLKKPEERRNKKKKLQRQKEQTSGEWAEKRMSGREEARKKHQKQQQEINWFLKRKNEREMHRLESSAGQEL